MQGPVEFIIDQTTMTGNILKLKVICIDDYFADQGAKIIYPTVEVSQHLSVLCLYNVIPFIIIQVSLVITDTSHLDTCITLTPYSYNVTTRTIN